MNRTILQAALTAAQARLTRDRDSTLAASGMPSGLAVLALALLEPLAAHDDPDEVADLLRDLVGTEQRKPLRTAMRGDLAANLCAFDDHPALADACRALVQAVADGSAVADAVHVQMRLDVGDSSSASNVRQVVQGPHSVYTEAPLDPAQQRQQRALADYLRGLKTECGVLQLGTVDEDEASRPQMPLEHVYIRLHTERRVALTPEEREQAQRTARLRVREDGDTRPLTALEALGQLPQRLMLLGAPGSGKSTFVNHLVLCCAGAWLCKHAQQADSADNWLARLPRWTLGTLLPVRVVLRDFAAFESSADAAHDSLQRLHAFLAHALGVHAEALEPIKNALSGGRALLLFDGLDEVVGDAVLQRVVASISAAAGTYPGCPVLVTCRMLDYESEPARQLPRFGVERLAALDDEQIAQFVAAWYAGATATGRQLQGTPGELQAAIAQRPELRSMAGLPLLVTMMAIVHGGRGILPHARSLLYAECVRLLLVRWRQQQPGTTDLLARLAVPNFEENDLLVLMARLGFAAHEFAERPVSDDERPADLSEREAMRLLAEGFAPYNSDTNYGLAQTVLNAVARGNGLLLKRGPDEYAFAHRSFQEFLAGYHLKGQREYLKLCLEHSPKIHWHETLSLMVSYQALKDGEFERPINLAEKLLARSLNEQALAGELLLLIGRERVTGYAAELTAPDGLWQRACDQLTTLATSSTASEVPAALRVRAGMAAGQLRYGALETVRQADATPPFPDPRLPLAVLGLAAQQEAWWSAALDQYWCELDDQPFWFGDDTGATPLQKKRLGYNFKIARFPVTNADFARFLQANGADGYDLAEPWWTEEGRKWFMKQEGREPRYWSDTSRNNPAQPVVGVSWYEAAAYCRWLTAEGQQHGWLPTHMELRLPTSLEWERAARGTDQRRYPWGNTEPTPEHANYNETGIGQPAPVGCFPLGAAACGAQDVAGNVLEWLATPYQQAEQIAPEKNFTPRDRVLLSDGAFRWKKERLCCGARGGFVPVDWDLVRGFRVVWSLARSE